MNEAELSNLIGLIYESASDDSGWVNICGQLGKHTNNSTVVLDANNTFDLKYGVLATSEFDNRLLNLHFEEYETPDKNPGVAALMNARQFRPFSLNSFIDDVTYDSDPSIRAILHPQKFDKGLFVTLDNNQLSFGYIGFFRRENDDEFEPEHEQFLKFISPHIHRSINLRSSVGQWQTRKRILDIDDPLSTLTQGIILLSRTNHVIEVNRTAEAILEARVGIEIRRGKLHSSCKTRNASNEDLQKFLNGTNSQPSSFVCSISATTHLVIKLTEMNIAINRLGNSTQKLITLNIVHSQRPPDIETYSKLFGLTPAQKRLLYKLIETKNASEAAVKLGIRRDTVKSHLEQIYLKTDTNSLAKLMLHLGKFTL